MWFISYFAFQFFILRTLGRLEPGYKVYVCVFARCISSPTLRILRVRLQEEKKIVRKWAPKKGISHKAKNKNKSEIEQKK